MPEQQNGRAWVAKCQWEGAAKPFWFGTVFVRLDAPNHEIEAEVVRTMREILPDRIEQPPIIALEPGSLVFIPENDGRAE